MNKELIKKYKAEFDYWIVGGELLYLAYGCNWAVSSNVTFDWVRHPESQNIYQINSLNIVHGGEHFELWYPKVNEWCWYGFELIEVIDTTNPLKICRQQSDSYEEVSVTMLEPFIGNLPSFIKDKR
jgi:hypothetical protein